MTIAVDISTSRFESPFVPVTGPAAGAVSRRLDIAVEQNLPALEATWREFQERADCTVFQTFEWLSSWQANIGARTNTTPVIVLGRDAQGKLAFILPLAVSDTPFGRELSWLGSELCDYNAPLLDRTFGDYISEADFAAAWADAQRTLQADPATRFDFARLEKMPKLVGSQPNPMLHLDVSVNPSGAHATALGGTWDEYYNQKRSSATRRRDRTKLKRLAGYGDISFQTARSSDEALQFFDTLIEQKATWFERRGISNLFANPGYAGFYRTFVGNTDSQKLIHVSRLQVGDQPASVNLGLAFQGRYHHVLASYVDGAMAHYGPGAAHLRELIKYAIERGLRVFDFTIGDEGYKRDWCETETLLFDHLSGATFRGRLSATLLRAMRSSKRFVKQTPAIWRLVTMLRQKLFSRGAAAHAPD